MRQQVVAVPVRWYRTNDLPAWPGFPVAGADRPSAIPVLQARERLPHRNRTRSGKAVMLPSGGQAGRLMIAGPAALRWLAVGGRGCRGCALRDWGWHLAQVTVMAVARAAGPRWLARGGRHPMPRRL